VLSLVLAAIPAFAAAQSQPAHGDLTALDLEDLMKIEVTTASKSAQAVSRVPSAIFVIDQEMIRRSAAASIPEALRLAPGLDVAQVSASQWEVSIRGFNGLFANKVLVLVDGRSVYSPDVSGVNWDELDLPMEDIDRIEVIRGASGTLWGANAVNGVINVITKGAADTLGNRVSLEGGSLDREVLTAEHGSRVGKEQYLRVFAKHSGLAALELAPGLAGPDDWTSEVGGFRFDSGPNRDHFQLEGGFQTADEGQRSLFASDSGGQGPPMDSRFRVFDCNLTAHWDRSGSNGWSQNLQAYLSEDHRDTPEAGIERGAADIDFLTRLAPLGQHTFSIGAGYRYSPARDTASQLLQFQRPEPTNQIASWLLHDDWALGRHLSLVYGSEFSYDTLAGWAVQPNAQVLFTPDSKRTLWASLSRAVHTPPAAQNPASSQSAANESGGFPAPPGTETVVAAEAGYRYEPSSKLYLDLALFHDSYSKLNPLVGGTQGGGQQGPPSPISGDADGVELAGRWLATPSFTLSSVYSLFAERFDSNGPASVGQGSAPRNQFHFRADWSLGHGLEFDSSVYFTDSAIDETASAYWRLDSQLTWSPRQALSFSFGVRNAFDPRHSEAVGQSFARPELVPESLYLEARFKL
jgi:iron complex outermembrane receptor protein